MPIVSNCAFELARSRSATSASRSPRFFATRSAISRYGVRIEVAQAEILELPLDAPDSRDGARSARRCRASRARSSAAWPAASDRERAHVVQAVGELDDDDADVLGHRQEHLAQVLDLRVFFRLVRDARQLGDAVDELRDLVAELLGDLLARDDRVFDDVVQQRGGDRLRGPSRGRPGSRRRRAGARCTTRPRPGAAPRGPRRPSRRRVAATPRRGRDRRH